MENYYRILGLKLGATLYEVEEKHKELLKEFDPNELSDDDLKEFFKSEQDKVKEAYNNILKHLETKDTKIVMPSNRKNSSSKVLTRALLIGAVIFVGYLFIDDYSKEQKKNDYVSYYESGKQHQEYKDYQDAINDYDKCLNIYPDSDSIIAFKAQCYYEKGAYQNSITAYTKAIDMVYRQNADYFAGRGKSHSKLRKHREAQIDINKAISMQANNPEYHLLKGDDFWIQGKYNSAEKNYTKSLSLKKSAVAYYKRGNANYKLGKLADAISNYTYSIETKPSFKSDKDYAKAYRNRGIARYESCKAGACEDLRKAGNLGSPNAYNEYLRIKNKSECE
jgi:tetratricopeptide (TPR) repeat protein